MSPLPSEPRGQVALVETSDVLPGLLPFQSWDVLGTADEVLVRDPDTHPSRPYLHAAGLDLTQLAPATLERTDLDLTRPGAPDDRRIAKALAQHAVATGRAVYLLGPDDGGVATALAGMAVEQDVEIELVFLAQLPAGTELLRLTEVMRRLRDPDDGCPWDLEQDHRSLTRYLVEEAYELIDAIEREHDADLAEELGDVLLQVVFHAQVALDRRAFSIDDVARSLVDKLVRRHPHVFADGDAATAEDVQRNWDRLKTEEKAREGVFDGVPAALPGLALLETLQRKAAKRGVEPPPTDQLATQVGDGLAALAAAPDDAGREAAWAGALAGLVGLARAHGIDPEAAARAAGRSFRTEVEQALAGAGTGPELADPERWAAAWTDDEGRG